MDKSINIKRLVIYLVLAFAMTWAFEFAFIFNGFKWDLTDTASVSMISLGMLFPAIAHILTRAITKEGFKPAGKDSMMLGINLEDGRWKLFLFAILIPVFYSAAGDGLYCLLKPGAFDPSALNDAGMSNSMALIFPVNAVSSGVFVSFAAFGEEFGWRAYMMPKLNRLMGKYPALIVGGVIWGLWHAPLTCVGHNFGMDYPGFPYGGIVLMCVYCILLGAILTFVTEKTGSVWPAAFLHGVNNASPSFLSAFVKTDDPGAGIYLLFLCVLIPLLAVAVICYVWRGRRNLNCKTM